MISVDNFKKDFKNLCIKIEMLSDTDQDFEMEMSKFVSLYCDIDEFDTLCLSYMRNTDCNINSYIAFFILNIYYRRNKQISDLGKILSNHSYFSAVYPDSFAFLNLLYKMNYDKYNDMESLLNESKDLCIRMKQSSHVLHAYVEIFANAYESCPLDHRDKLKEKYLEEAIRYIDSIISKYPDYAKYYCTKARIQIIKADNISSRLYLDALQSIRKACLLEPKGMYFRSRIAEYERYENMILTMYNLLLSQMKLEERTKVVDVKIDSIDMKITEITIKNIEILGLFTAVISLIIGSLGILKDGDIRGNAILIIILTGSILIVYSCLVISLHEHEKKNLRYWILILGILLMIGSLIGVML